jgi:hypothetical protein
VNVRRARVWILDFACWARSMSTPASEYRMEGFPIADAGLPRPAAAGGA